MLTKYGDLRYEQKTANSSLGGYYNHKPDGNFPTLDYDRAIPETNPTTI